MAKKNKNVVKFRRPFYLNIGFVIFAVLLFYLIIEIVISIKHVKPSVYCVESSYIDNNFYVTGIAVRKETLVNAVSSGYVSYYIRDGERVGKNATVYTIDETGSVYDYLAETAGDSIKLAVEDYETIKKRITMFRSTYSSDNFDSVYNFKGDLQNLMLEVTNELLIEQATSNGNDLANTFKSVPSDMSGIVTYYQDGFESYTVDAVNQSTFQSGNYDKVSLKSGDIINAGSPVYKIVESDDWNIVAPLTENQVELLKEETVVTITIDNLNHEVDCNFELLSKSDGTYINIILNKLMVDFVDDRFLEVCIKVDSPTGLKIPNSAVVDINAYQIPISYLTAGSNSSTAKYLNKRVLDENGELSVVQISPNIYGMDEEYCYIDMQSLEPGDIIVAPNSTDTLSTNQLSTKPLTGVFSANKGTAQFKQVEIINKKDDFCIVKDHVDNSITLYDYILLDGESASEGQIIY